MYDCIAQQPGGSSHHAALGKFPFSACIHGIHQMLAQMHKSHCSDSLVPRDQSVPFFIKMYTCIFIRTHQVHFSVAEQDVLALLPNMHTHAYAGIIQQVYDFGWGWGLSARDTQAGEELFPQNTATEQLPSKHAHSQASCQYTCTPCMWRMKQGHYFFLFRW